MKRKYFSGKKLVALVCTLMMALQIGSVSVLAAPQIHKAKAEKGGKVEVDFRGKVQYQNPKVTVKDSNGKSYAVRITERDDDEMEFVIKNYKAGTKYTYQISGIRARGEKTYGKVSGTITTPKEAAGVAVKKAKYDRSDRELEISFTGKVRWTKATVKITDGKTTYRARITDRDDDELEVFVSGLKKGTRYQYTITGLNDRKTGKALTLSGNFTA